MKELRGLIDKKEALSMRRQCDLVGIHRSGLYYKPLGESEENLRIMKLMDEHFLEHPGEGVVRMRDFLFALGLVANHKRIRRLLRLMGIMAIYPKKNLSRLGADKYIYPYLLMGLSISRPDQVWAIDITYIPMEHGFMYLTAIIDVYSRYIVGWGISNTLVPEASLSVMQQAVAAHGKPEIVNSDQGSQFTSRQWTEYLKSRDIRISMDGRGRVIDNIFIERFRRKLKYDYVYLNPAADGLELYQGLRGYIDYYNNWLHHQGTGRRIPAELYRNAA